MTQLSGFTKRSYRQANVKAYSNRMLKGDETHLWNDTVAHILEEQGYSIKEDPRSIYEPQQLFDALERYSPENNTFIDQSDYDLRQGINMAWKVFAKPSDQSPLDALRSVQELEKAVKGEKFAGLPTMGKKRDDLIYGLDRESQVLSGTKAPAPCLAGKRTQRNNKTRLVWMYPMEMTLMEARFARPLIDRLLDGRTTMAFGMKSYVVGSLVDSICNQSGGTPVAIDYSKYDASVSSYFIRQAFKIIGTWFSQEDKEQLGFDTIVNYFIHTPIVMIDGKLYLGKKHGIPSGSYFTQIVGSIVNTILIGALSSKLKLGIQWTKFLVLGDDVIMNIENPNLDEMKEFFKTFGIILNTDKTQFKAHFLGADWKFGKPHRNFGELLSMAVQPEGFKKMGRTDSERMVSAYTLLINYAATYVNATSMLDKRFRSPMHMNLYEHDLRTDLMTGSDRFFAEYGRQLEMKSVSRPTLVRRFLS